MSPETKLFRAVINQAVEDILEPEIEIKAYRDWAKDRFNRRDESSAARRRAYSRYVEALVKYNKGIARDREKAANWLTRNSPDFRRVCRYADLDPGYVVMKIKTAEILNGRL